VCNLSLKGLDAEVVQLGQAGLKEALKRRKMPYVLIVEIERKCRSCIPLFLMASTNGVHPECEWKGVCASVMHYLRVNTVETGRHSSGEVVLIVKGQRRHAHLS